MGEVTGVGLVLMFLLHFENSESVNFPIHVLPGNVNQLGNERECGSLSKKHGKIWALPNGRESAQMLTRFMIRHNLSAVWLGIRRSSLESWQWINGEKDEQFINSPGVHGCAVLTLSQVIKPHECADETKGLICNIPENITCPKSQQESYCTSAHSRKYWFRCYAKNWFSARNECQRHGGDLVVLQNNQIKDILQAIAEDQPISCTSYFIGLHREYWLRTTPSGDNWSYESSTNPNNRNDTPCMNMSAVSCDSQADGCLDVSGTVALAVVPVVTLIIVSAVACLFFRKYLKEKKKRITGQEIEMNNLQEPLPIRLAHCEEEQGGHPVSDSLVPVDEPTSAQAREYEGAQPVSQALLT